jgi:hypothetical protein
VMMLWQRVQQGNNIGQEIELLAKDKTPEE